MIVKDPQDCVTMAEVRAGVDGVDRQIVRLLAQRFGYMDAAARIKEARTDVRDEARKAEVLQNVRNLAGDLGLEPAVISDLYDRLIEASIAYELHKFDAAETAARRPS